MNRSDYSPQDPPAVDAPFQPTWLRGAPGDRGAPSPARPRGRGTGARPERAGPARPARGESLRPSIGALLLSVACASPPFQPPPLSAWTAAERAAVEAALAAQAEGAVDALPPPPAAPSPPLLNRMALESSPYLRAHARQPIDWRPYGASALLEAKTTGRPIFLSVGYATCHWCHVMSAQVYGEADVAALLNGRFIPILVDRQERPEVDRLAMTLLLGMTGRGGWPLHLVLSPEGAPLWGGGVLPARPDPARPGAPAMLTVLEALSQTHTEPGRLAAGARLLAAAEAARSPAEGGDGADSTAPVALRALRPAALQAALRATTAPVRRGPRFPLARAPGLLLEAAEAGHPEAEAALRAELAGWLDGALLDPVEGGFFRYTTDADWQTPHYEKMLLDNVLIAELLLGALSLDPPAEGGPGVEAALRLSLDWLLDRLRTPSGCFGAGLDADSPGPEGPVEGLSYTFTPASLRAAVAPWPAPEAALARPPAGAPDSTPRPLLGAALRLPEAPRLRAALRADRAARPQPALDPAELLGANALAVKVLAEAAGALEAPAYLEAAARCAARLRGAAEGAARPRQQVGARASGEATLFDRAALQQAALALAAENSDPEAIAWARRESEHTAAQRALAGGGWSEPTARWSGSDAAPGLAPLVDGAEPSGYARMLRAEGSLAEWTGAPEPRARAEAALRAAAQALEGPPGRAASLIAAAAALDQDTLTIVIIEGEGEGEAEAADALWAARARSAARGAPAWRLRPGDDRSAAPAWAADKGPAGAETVAVVCFSDRCLAPISDPEPLRAALRAARRGAEAWAPPASAP